MSDGDQAIRDVVKGTSVVYVGLVLQMLIAFVAQVLAARYLSVSGFGGLTTGTALVSVGAILGGFGLAPGLARYLPRIEPEQKRSLVTTTIGVTILSSTVIGGVVTLGAPYIASDVFGDQSVTASIRIFGAAIPFAAVLNVSIGGLRGQKRSLSKVAVQNFAQPIARFSLVMVAVILGLGQAGFAWAYAVPYAVALAVAIILLYRALPPSRFSLDVELTKRVVNFSLPLTISGVAGFIYRSIDIFLILHFLGSFAVGVYGVAYAAANFMGLFSTAFSFLAGPVASELEHGGNINEVLDLFAVVSRWLVIGSVCAFIPLGVFSTEFITIIYQPRYASGGIVLTILALTFALRNVLSVNAPVLNALGRSRIQAVNSTIAAAVNLGLNIVLIPAFGIPGAAIATLLAYVVRDGLIALEIRYIVDGSPLRWYALRPAFVAVPFIAVFVLLIAPRIPTTIPWLVGSSVAFSVLYCGTTLLSFGLSETEVMVVRSAEEKYGLGLQYFEPVIHYLSNR